MSQLTWRRIRQACEDEGLPIREWEDELHHKLIRYMLDHQPKSKDRYLHDPTFRAQVEMLVNAVVACIFDHDPLNDPVLRSRVEELGDLFRKEAGIGPD